MSSIKVLKRTRLLSGPITQFAFPPKTMNPPRYLVSQVLNFYTVRPENEWWSATTKGQEMVD